MPGEIGGGLDQEAEANAFAMELLMPREFIARELKQIGPGELDVVVKRLAAKFEVEPSTMQARLLQLGYILG